MCSRAQLSGTGRLITGGCIYIAIILPPLFGLHRLLVWATKVLPHRLRGQLDPPGARLWTAHLQQGPGALWVSPSPELDGFHLPCE